MRGGRGQVTLFVIVGLVLLIIVGLLYALLSQRTQAPTVIDIASHDALNNYVTSCLDTIVEDELAKAGSSGGLSAISATGFSYGVIGNNTNVVYGLTRNRRSTADIIPAAGLPYNVSSPDPALALPAPLFDLSNDEMYWNGTVLESLPSLSDGYFGQVNLPPPCSREGQNGLGSTVLCRFYPGIPPGTVRSMSVQEGLTAQVQRRIGECVNVRQFTEAAGQEVAAVSTPNVTIKFTRNNVLVHLDYSLTIQGEAKSITAPFDRRYDVRYLAVSEYAFDIARQEARDITFNLSRDYRDTVRIPSYDGFNVTRATITLAPDRRHLPAGGSEKADLVTITDGRSRVRGKPFSFSFLIEHRPPVLDAALAQTACDITDPRIGLDPDDGPIVQALVIDGVCTLTDADGDRSGST